MNLGCLKINFCSTDKNSRSLKFNLIADSNFFFLLNINVAVILNFKIIYQSVIN